MARTTKKTRKRSSSDLPGAPSRWKGGLYDLVRWRQEQDDADPGLCIIRDFLEKFEKDVPPIKVPPSRFPPEVVEWYEQWQAEEKEKRRLARLAREARS